MDTSCATLLSVAGLLACPAHYTQGVKRDYQRCAHLSSTQKRGYQRCAHLLSTHGERLSTLCTSLPPTGESYQRCEHPPTHPRKEVINVVHIPPPTYGSRRRECCTYLPPTGAGGKSSTHSSHPRKQEERVVHPVPPTGAGREIYTVIHPREQEERYTPLCTPREVPWWVLITVMHT